MSKYYLDLTNFSRVPNKLARLVRDRVDNGNFKVVKGYLNSKKSRPEPATASYGLDFEDYMGKMGYTPRQKQVLRLMN